MTATRSTVFSGETRAQDGLIVTFELAGGERLVERFSQLVVEGDEVRIKSRQKRHVRVRTRIGPPSIEQAAARADELGAKIVSISSPETILRDLQGSRARLEPQVGQKHPADMLQLPEVMMLGRIGRADLALASHGTAQRPSVRTVTARQASRRGPRGQ